MSLKPDADISPQTQQPVVDRLPPRPWAIQRSTTTQHRSRDYMRQSLPRGFDDRVPAAAALQRYACGGLSNHVGADCEHSHGDREQMAVRASRPTRRFASQRSYQAL